MRYSDSAKTAAQGVRLVASIVEDELGWIYREKTITDIGVDGEIEVLDDERRSTGQLLAVQIKTGPSWFREKSPDGWIYRGDLNHLEYWERYALPVVIVLCDVVERRCYWSAIVSSAYDRLNHGFKLNVPAINRLGSSSKSQLKGIVRFDVTTFGDLCVKDWLHNKFPRRVEFASIFEQPPDYHWLTLLARIDDEIYVIGTAYDRLGAFDAQGIGETVKWMLYSAKLLSEARMMLCLIARNPRSHRLDAAVCDAVMPIPEEGRFRFLARTEFVPSLSEILPDGSIVDEYVAGEALWVYERLDDDYKVVPYWKPSGEH